MPFVYQTGAVVTDPSLPVQNVDAKVELLAAFYDRTFSFFGRSASALIAIPYVWAKVTGDVLEERRTVTRSGQGDMQLRFASSILGAPALTPAEFARRPPGPSLGASLTVLAPIGQYFDDKLINIGTNRWSFKPELGVSTPVRRWLLEAALAATLFTDNDDFFGGQTREQDPIYSSQGHVIYNFPKGRWASLAVTYFTGGQTTLDETVKDDLQKNWRVGATWAFPLNAKQSLKLYASSGVEARTGNSFDLLGFAWQYRWFAGGR